MSEIKRKTEESIEDVERISNIMNRKIKKSNVKLGARAMTKNPYLRFNGGFSLIEKFPEYKDKRKQGIKR